MKNITFFLLLITVMFACRGKKSENKHIIKEYFSHFNKHEWDKMAEMYKDTAEFKDPSLGKGLVKQTREQIAQKYSELNKTFADINDKVIQIYPSNNNHIVVEFISSGTAPDGSKFELPICTIFTIENGKISKDYTYYDNFEEK
jgi:ketosteroid isomerase-like protein